MIDTDFNPDAFKQNQRNDWNTVSSGWERWWHVIEKGAGIISERMLEMADVASGHHVLDVATGIGEPALSAARRVGPEGHVTAVDQAKDMLAIARRRAETLGLSNVTFQEMDAEMLGMNTTDFDGVLCRWGLMFMPDVDTALTRICQTIKRDGRIAAAVWSSPEKVPSISLPMGVVRELLQIPPPPPGTPNPFCLADTALLEQMFQQAGFRDICIESIMVDFAMPSAEVYTEFTRDINAPLVALLADRSSEQQDMVWEAITEAVRRYEAPDGSIHIENEAICISGIR